MEPISLLVLIIGFIGRPLAEAVRDRYVDDLVQQLPDLAGPVANRVRHFVAGTARGDSEARRQLEMELAANQQAMAALTEAVQAQTGEAIPSAGASPPASRRMRDSQTIFLDGYQRALYNLTLTAVFAGRPVVVDAALQGPDWLTACIPQFGDDYGHIRRGSFPDPERLWTSYNPQYVEHGFGQGDLGTWPVSYYVRWMPNREERDRELAEREKQFRFEPQSSFRSDLDAPPEQRWLQILRVRPMWVQLESFGFDFQIPQPAYDDILERHFEQLGRKREPKSRDSLSFGDYPDEWKRLLEIPRPDEGVRLLMDAADRLVAREDQVRDAIQEQLNRKPFGGGPTD